MSNKKKLAELLHKGASQVEAARALGVTESYVSQLQNDDEYLRIYDKLVGGTKLASHARHAKIDDHYDSVELKIAEYIDANSSMVLPALMSKPAQLLATMRTINGLKRRGSGEGTQTTQVNTVELQLPNFIVAASTPQVVKSINNEVIEVDGKPLVSLQDSAMRRQLETLEAEQAAQLPTASHTTVPVVPVAPIATPEPPELPNTPDTHSKPPQPQPHNRHTPIPYIAPPDPLEGLEHF